MQDCQQCSNPANWLALAWGNWADIGIGRTCNCVKKDHNQQNRVHRCTRKGEMWCNSNMASHKSQRSDVMNRCKLAFAARLVVQSLKAHLDRSEHSDCPFQTSAAREQIHVHCKYCKIIRLILLLHTVPIQWRDSYKHLWI